jgi:hypothetical protein
MTMAFCVGRTDRGEAGVASCELKSITTSPCPISATAKSPPRPIARRPASPGCFCARDERLPHAAFRADNDDPRHKIFHSRYAAALQRGAQHLPVLGLIGTSGRRNSSSITFIIASAAFTGVGLVSMNKSLNNG